MATVEDLQSSLDRAKEKLQENSYTLSENDKEIAKLNTDVEAVSAAYCNYAGYVSTGAHKRCKACLAALMGSWYQ